jgi:hypothetical protein
MSFYLDVMVVKIIPILCFLVVAVMCYTKLCMMMMIMTDKLTVMSV